MTATCLFTGVELDPDTKEEHTIQRSLGGRIVSRQVTSSDFNNRCGSFCDDSLSRAYGLLLSRLAPLLPSVARPGAIKAMASDSPADLVIEAGGIVATRGFTILEKDPKTRRPTKVLGPDEAGLRNFASRAQMSIDAPISFVPLTDRNVVTTPLHLISPLMELAALKSILLTFDCMQSDQIDRFTRSPYLEKLRAMVRASVEEKRVDFELFESHSLGIQLEKLALYEALRNSIPFERTPFEHVMLVSGNFAQRCLDAVWIVFGFEPFGFRLCNDYAGRDFSYGLVNPVTKGRSASGVFDLPLTDDLLCRPTDRRSFRAGPPRPTSLATAAQVGLEIATNRAKAFDLAVFHVYMSADCDDWLIERLQELQVRRCFGTMFELLEFRIHNLFPHHGEATSFRLDVAETLGREMKRWNADRSMPADLDTPQSRAQALDALRPTLKALVDRYGMPGGGYSCDPEISNDEQTWTRLGV